MAAEIWVEGRNSGWEVHGMESFSWNVFCLLFFFFFNFVIITSAIKLNISNSLIYTYTCHMTNILFNGSILFPFGEQLGEKLWVRKYWKYLKYNCIYHLSTSFSPVSALSISRLNSRSSYAQWMAGSFYKTESDFRCKL